MMIGRARRRLHASQSPLRAKMIDERVASANKPQPLQPIVSLAGLRRPQQGNDAHANRTEQAKTIARVSMAAPSQRIRVK